MEGENSMENLTEKETEALHYVKLGYTNRQIAEAMSVSYHTAKAHVSSILRKLGVKNRLCAVLKANEIEDLRGSE